MNLKAFKDLTGKSFDRLTVIKRVGSNKHGKAIWLCRCRCGGEKVAVCGDLTHGTTRSCGCIKKEADHNRFLTHGMENTKQYNSWRAMKYRCQNPNDTHYAEYGGRGITVCPEWQSFEGFWKDMGKTYQLGLSIDRIDVNGNYEPGNCRWADSIQQGTNRRNNRRITFKKQTKTLSEWARIVGIDVDTIGNRLNKLHWPIERALTTPPSRRTK